MTTRVHNFNAGPAALPLAVLQQAQAELLDFGGTGMSILESSHRGPVYDEIHEQAIAGLRVLFGGSDDHAILFMGGGAQTQFGLIPMNLLPQGRYADYLETGVWGETAREEAAKIGDARTLWSSSASGHDRVPGPDDYEVSPGAAYLHYTSNNSIMGTQYHVIPEAGDVPLVCDMSSDILTYPVDLERFGIVYGGAQKNLGAAGVTLVVIRQDMLDSCRSDLPTMLSYKSMAATNSLQNTPPVFAIYIVGLIASHMLEQGGMTAVAARNEKKAALLYGVVDGSGGFYQGHAQRDSRSRMNVTFHLPSEELTALFVGEAAGEGLLGLKGHSALGGIRVSLYNAVTVDAVHALTDFMATFQKRHG
jgi:phosphoserine aminotransferase